MVLPVRPQAQNNADVLLAELDKLGQSEGDEEVHGGGMDKRSLLLSDPVQIIVTCLTPPTGTAPRFFPHQHWEYNEKQRIRILNADDPYCMFHALVAARAYHDQTLCAEQRRLGQQQQRTADETLCADSNYLKRLVEDQQRMCRAVHRLMSAAGVPINLDTYGLEQLEMVQRYWVINQ